MTSTQSTRRTQNAAQPSMAMLGLQDGVRCETGSAACVIRIVASMLNNIHRLSSFSYVHWAMSNLVKIFSFFLQLQP